jgi:ribosomal protein L11 methyltransferase
VLLEFTLLADEDSTEPLADALLEAGALSVAIEDADAASDHESPLFGEPGLEPARQAWQRSRLRVLLDGNRQQAERLIGTAANAIGLAAELPIESSSLVEDTDWVSASQSQFPPTRISERLWIVPSWHEIPDPSALVVRLDPGVAFGTGTHPTTQLCLAWLDQNVASGATVLDYGCGSGILAIAAGKLGAGTIVGVDIDEQALAAARANTTANAVAARYTGPAGLAPGLFDIVVANILSNPLKLLAPALLARVAPGGALVLSGVLERQANEVIAAYREADATVDLRVWQAADGWVCLTGRRAA